MDPKTPCFKGSAGVFKKKLKFLCKEFGLKPTIYIEDVL